MMAASSTSPERDAYVLYGQKLLVRESSPILDGGPCHSALTAGL